MSVADAPVPCGGSYLSGCRCRRCKDWMNRYQRDAYRRRRNNVQSPTDLLSPDAARADLVALREAGVVWRDIAGFTGTDKRNLQRLHYGTSKYVTRYVEGQLAKARAELVSSPPLGRLVPSGRARWMLNCLSARGWSSEYVGKALGWNDRLKLSDLCDTVTVGLEHRIEVLFLDLHWRDGVSRRTQLRALRSGSLPADCYDWEGCAGVPVVIPGTLPADLLVSAATYQNDPDGVHYERIVALMRGLGQWLEPECAAAALREWVRVSGRAGWQVSGPYCSDPGHGHRALAVALSSRVAPSW